MKNLFMVEFSDKGCNHRQEEEQAYVHFIDFMDECEGIYAVNVIFNCVCGYLHKFTNVYSNL